MKELLSFHFLLEDVPFKIKTVLNLAEIQVDFELNLYGSLYLLYFLVQLQSLLLLDLVLETLLINLFLFEVLNRVDHFILESSELHSHT